MGRGSTERVSAFSEVPRRQALRDASAEQKAASPAALGFSGLSVRSKRRHSIDIQSVDRRCGGAWNSPQHPGRRDRRPGVWRDVHGRKRVRFRALAADTEEAELALERTNSSRTTRANARH